jgi:hypothetical protein
LTKPCGNCSIDLGRWGNVKVAPPFNFLDEKDYPVPRRKMDIKSKAYTWVAFMMTHEPVEIAKLLKYGTPSEELIRLSNSRTEITVDVNDKRWMTFPVSLNKSAGQKLIFKAAQDVYAFKKLIPLGAYLALQEVKDLVKTRRKDTQDNIHLVAEAIMHRCASEFKSEVLFSFDSINAWIKAKTGKTLGYITIRKAIELLEEKFFLKVREWGVKGNRRRCTKIYVNFDSAMWTALEHLPACDKWILENSASMQEVYVRENTTRLDVLEANIHKYADRILLGETSKARLFPASDDKLSVDTLEIVNIEEEVLWDDAYIDRLLGSLVPSMHKDVSYSGEVSSSIRGPD